ncbi:unnamed protein product [Meloidogyne enterolobii]|uniref:Uncharacterized protein n=1 Tax=Meloidogyne enterolobii TaxID=390850 RepID=A0ACB0Y2R7_MELEN
MNNNLGNNNGCYGIGEIEEEKEFLQHPKPPVKLPRRSKESVAFHRDPFNKPELVHTLKGRELIIFTILYIIGVVGIVILFEHVMPVIFIDEKMLAEQNRRSKIYLANQMLS